MRPAIACRALVAAALVGCGVDDGDADGGPARAPDRLLTKAEYEHHYRAAREEGDETRERLQKVFETAGPDDTDQIADALRGFAGNVRETATGLDALQPPRDIATEHQRYVDVLERTAAAYDDAADGVANADSPEDARVAMLESLQVAFANEDSLRAAED